MILIGRTLAALAAVNALVLAVFVGLASLQFNAILSNLTRERLVVLAETVRAPFQAVADLGVAIGTVRNADAVLERARQSDDAIVAVHVISADGEIVRSTATSDGKRAESRWLSSARNAGARETWQVETRGRFLVGANIAGPAGGEAGSVLIEYSKHGATVQVQAMEAKLVLLAALVFAATVLAGFFVLRLSLAEHLRLFDGLLATFDGFEKRFWRGSGAVAEPETDASALGLDTASFRELLERSEDRYEAEKRTKTFDPS